MGWGAMGVKLGTLRWDEAPSLGDSLKSLSG